MLRIARSPRWLGGLLLAILAAAVCAGLGRWQWDRSQGRGGDLQNLAYAFNWWLFSALCLWFWAKALRDEARRRADPDAAPVGRAGLSRTRAAAQQPVTASPVLAVPAGEDAEVDEWNAWLAELDSRRSKQRR